MPSAYQEFARQARERYLERQKRKAAGPGQYRFTLHAQFKMKQYGLSEQRVRSVIRHPKRSEVGIMPKAVAVMQPVSMKKIDGKEIWKQEIWVMYIQQAKGQRLKARSEERSSLLDPRQLKIISAWRYPGVSPKRDPIPDEILRELEEGSILEIGDEI